MPVPALTILVTLGLVILSTAEARPHVGPQFVDVGPERLMVMLAAPNDVHALRGPDGERHFIVPGANPHIVKTPLSPGGWQRVCVVPERFQNATVRESAHEVEWIRAALAVASDSAEGNDDEGIAAAAAGLYRANAARIPALTLEIARQLVRRGHAVLAPRSAADSARSSLRLALQREWQGYPNMCFKQDIAGDANQGYYELCFERHLRWATRAQEGWVAGVDGRSRLRETTVLGRYAFHVGDFRQASDHVVAQYPHGDPCSADPNLPNLRHEALIVIRCRRDMAAANERDAVHWSVRELPQCVTVVTLYSDAVCEFTGAASAPALPCADVPAE